MIFHLLDMSLNFAGRCTSFLDHAGWQLIVEDNPGIKIHVAAIWQSVAYVCAILLFCGELMQRIREPASQAHGRGVSPGG
jgi:hypothetical protein